MKNTLLWIVLSLAFQTASAQITINVNNSLINTGGAQIVPMVGGFPVDNTRYINLSSGSPFYQTDWATSTLVNKQGSVYAGIPIKLNLLENTVHYKDSLGKELVVGTPLSQVELAQAPGGKNVLFINGDMLPAAKKGWYQLMVNDKLTLVKGFKKSLEEHTSYNSPVEYSIKTTETYYAYLNNKEQEVRKASDIAEMVPEKKAEIDVKIKELGKLPREVQLVTIVQFANTLIK